VIENVDKKTQATAMAWSLMGVFSSQGIGFIVSIFLARLLTPDDFGLVGMSLVFVNLLQVVVDAGFSTALIQRKQNSQETYDAVFSFNLFVAIVLMMGFWGAAPAIGRFYEEPMVEALVFWLSVALPLNALSLVQRSILERGMRFKELGIRTVVAGAISGIIGVTLALYGFGVYALVGQVLSMSLVNVVALWYVSEWRPVLKQRPSWRPLKELFNFSKFVFFGSVMNKAMTEGSALVIGKMFSPATLGYYTRANSLNLQISRYLVTTVHKVYLPVLSKLQDETEQFRNVLLNVLLNCTFIALFLTGILYLSGNLIIIGMFGSQWGPSVLIFQVILCRGFTFPLNSLLVSSIYAIGKAKLNFQLAIVKNIIRIVPFIVAYTYGFYPFLYSLVGIAFVGVFINMYGVEKIIKISVWDQVKPVFIQVVIFIVAMGATYWLSGLTIKSKLTLDTISWETIMITVFSVIMFSVFYLLLSLILLPKLPVQIKEVYTSYLKRGATRN
jgi:O-antigen/teichoic acid export membrane protein